MACAQLDQTLGLPFVLAATRRAPATATSAIWNSDQGRHFTGPQYLALPQGADVRISMDGKGHAMDNIFTERLWRTVTYEEAYLHDDASPKEAQHGLTRYLTFYNDERPHQALSYKTPAEVTISPSPTRKAIIGWDPHHPPLRKETSPPFLVPLWCLDKGVCYTHPWPLSHA